MFRVGLLVLMLCVVSASWPPSSCPEPTILSGRGKNIMTLTNKRIRNIRSSCPFNDVFGQNVYIKFKRIFNGKDIHPRTQSTLTFQVKFSSQQYFDIELNNDKLKIINISNDTDVKSRPCLIPLASNDPEWNSWMRIRVNRLYEISRTFVTIDLAEYTSSTFSPCTRFEMNLTRPHFNVGVSGWSNSGMLQEVHDITSVRPVLQPPPSSASLRLDRLEQKIARLQETVHKYMQDHEEHVIKTKAMTQKIRAYTTNTKNTLEHKANSHMMIWLFVLMVTGTLICFFVSYKFKREKRFHLL